MTELKIKDGRLTLKNGTLTVRSRDLDQPEKATNKEDQTSPRPEAEGTAKKPKTTAERQRELYERRKAEGWKKIWVDPETLELAELLGGVEHIPADRREWVRKTAELEQKRRRRWWRFW